MEEAVSEDLKILIKELLSLDFLNGFALAGGTNLALKYNHRISIDIDLFTSDFIGIKGFEEIQEKMNVYFGKRILKILYPICKSDRDVFLRCLIKSKNNAHVKVELLHNMSRLDPIEIVDGIKLYTKRDIGLFKIVSSVKRKAHKDIYDLNFITDEIELSALLEYYKLKKEKYNQIDNLTVFEKEGDKDIAENIHLLLAFDSNYQDESRPIHSERYINLIAGGKKWPVAKYEWRKKVRSLMS